MNYKIFLIAALSVSIVLAVAGAAVITKQSPQDTYDNAKMPNLAPPYHKLKSIASLSLAEASKKVSFTFKVPTLSTGYKVVGASVGGSATVTDPFSGKPFLRQSLTIWVWNGIVTDATLDADVVHNGGYFLLVDHTFGENSTKYYQEAYGASPNVEIKYLWGNPANIAHGDPSRPNTPSALNQIQVYKVSEHNSYVLVSALPIDVMMGVMESVIKG